MILVLCNVMIESSNVSKKKSKLLNVTKIRSNVMLVLLNMILESSNVTKKNKIK